MRHVTFKEIGMENYGPYIEPMIIPIHPNYMTLIVGKNGIGKTMILDALPYTLYGITSKKAKGDDVVNNKIKKDCKTWVIFSIDSDNYLLTRYHNYTKLGNTVILTKNGVDVLKGHREVLPEVEKIICPQKAFMNTLMFGQKVKDFFTDLLDSDKKEIFRKILNLEIYSDYYKIVDEQLKEIDKTIIDLGNKISVDTNLFNDCKEQIITLNEAKQKYSEELNKEINELEKSIIINETLKNTWQVMYDKMNMNDFSTEKIIQQINSLSIEISNLENTKNNLYNDLLKQKETKEGELNNDANKARLKISNDLNQKNTELNSISSKLIEEKNLEISEKREKINEYKVENSSNQSTLNSLKEKINEIHHAIFESDQSTCPTCEQEVSEETTEKLSKKIKEYKNQIENITLLISKNNINISKVESEIKDIESKYKTLINENILAKEQGKFEHKQANEDIDKRVKEVILKLDIMFKDQVKNTSENIVNQIEEKIKEKKNLDEEKIILENLKIEHNEMKEKINNIVSDISSLQKQIKFLESKEYDETQLLIYIQKEKILTNKLLLFKQNIIDATTDLEIFQFWKTAFSPSGIPSMLIDESIPFMNKKVSEYLDMLSNGRYIVSFDTLGETKKGELKDKISVRVIDTETQADSRIQLSGGQTRIIDIASILTLGELQSAINDVTFNILLFDEIFDSLDYDNIGFVSKVLNKLKVEKSIFIISHQHQDQLESDETLNLF